MTLCPCQSGKDYSSCCEPIIKGLSVATTAESLMRSRYSAFTTSEIAHLEDTLHPDFRSDYDASASKKWADQSEWLGLEVVQVTDGMEGDETGTVEFIAIYRQKGNSYKHHERATFHRQNGRWYYTDGETVVPQTVRRSTPKAGRNDPCPCGSGKKHKKCCLSVA